MESEVPTPSPEATPEPVSEAPAASNGDGPHPPTAVEESPAKNRSVQDMFRFSDYVHVGPGADTCEDAENGSCGNPLHFHSWCRLPNKFQQSSIQEKAQAARARATRQLRNPETDKHAIIENDMETLLRLNSKDALVEELLSKDYMQDHLAAMQQVAEEEEFNTIEEDQRRFKVLVEMPEEERPADEFKELTSHIEAFQAKVDEARDEAQKPKREALDGKEMGELVDLIRDQRIANIGDEAYMRSYNLWQWFIGTLKPIDTTNSGLPTERAFASVEHMQQAAPEVIEAIEQVFADLEGEFAMRLQTAARAEGNS
jgi:hypothetical protein